jgi:hypothetical protein
VENFEVSKADIIETVALSRKSNEYATYSKCIVTLLDDNGKATDEQYKVTLDNTGWNIKRIGSALNFNHFDLGTAIELCFDHFEEERKAQDAYDNYESGQTNDPYWDYEHGYINDIVDDYAADSSEAA